MKNALFILFSLLLLNTSLFAEETKHNGQINLGLFNIAGITLGMSFDEAIDLACKYYQVSKESVKLHYHNALNPITNNKEITHFTIQHNKANLEVSLIPAIPYNKAKPMIVWKVEYTLPGDSEKKLFEAAIKKYGKGFKATGFGAVHEWCHKPNKDKSSLATRCKGATISFYSKSMIDHSVRLELKDSSYIKRYRKVTEEILTKKSQTPRI